jgi:mannitol-specific phosphotransferase system IIBC component
LGNVAGEPGPPVFILSRRLFQQETQMRNLIIAVCCAALVGSVSVASAQTTAPTGRDSVKTHNPMNANAKMKKTSKKSAKAKSDDSTKSYTSKDDMKKDSK